MSKIRKASEGLNLRGTVNGIQRPLLEPGDTYTSLKMPTKPELLAIPQGYLGITHAQQGVITAVSVVPEDSKAAHKARKQLSAPA